MNLLEFYIYFFHIPKYVIRFELLAKNAPLICVEFQFKGATGFCVHLNMGITPVKIKAVKVARVRDKPKPIAAPLNKSLFISL